MIEAPLALAFTAGMVATVNPCGFAMLPAYLAYYLGIEEQDAEQTSAIGRALVVAGAVSVGFLVVFAVTGTLFSAGARSFLDYVPWISIVIGLALVGLGIAMLAGFHPRVSLPQRGRAGSGRGLRSLVAFGVFYAIASLSCTLPVFLTVVSGTITRSNFASGLAVFLAYGLGMSLVLAVLTLAVALAKDSFVRWLRAASRHVNRVSGALLVVAGTYITYYWVFNLSTDVGTTTGAGPLRFVGNLSSTATNWIDRQGLVLGILLATVVASATTYAVILHYFERNEDAADEEADAERTPLEEEPAGVGTLS